MEDWKLEEEDVVSLGLLLLLLLLMGFLFLGCTTLVLFLDLHMEVSSWGHVD